MSLFQTHFPLRVICFTEAAFAIELNQRSTSRDMAAYLTWLYHYLVIKLKKRSKTQQLVLLAGPNKAFVDDYKSKWSKRTKIQPNCQTGRPPLLVVFFQHSPTENWLWIDLNNLKQITDINLSYKSSLSFSIRTHFLID
jgi:hypothetical protein